VPRRLDAVLDALAEPTRRRVVEILRRGPRRAGDLAALLPASPPALSRHLRVLRASGIVAGGGAAGDRRVRVYRLRRGALRDLRRWLVEVESYWNDQLASFRAHAERSARGGRP
jgi:DNA-binding transcriptional ArsR family regulator